MDYKKFYFLEEYLFKDVRDNFHANGKIDAFDFFCIIIWKANRVKTTIAEKIRANSKLGNLDEICREITSGIYTRHGPEEKLRYLLNEWKFGLPIASTILTVFYPDDFTIYDRRVSDVLNDFKKLNNISDVDARVRGYFNYVRRVREYTDYPTQDISLRDKDRYLWGESFCNELVNDIKNGLKKKSKA